MHSLIAERRRFRSRAVRLTDALPESGRTEPQIEQFDPPDPVPAALLHLKPRRRTVVLLRHLDRLRVAEAAATAGLSAANVKAAPASGLLPCAHTGGSPGPS